MIDEAIVVESRDFSGENKASIYHLFT